MLIHVATPVVDSQALIQATFTRQTSKGHQHYMAVVTYKTILLHTESVEFMEGVQSVEWSIPAEEVGLMNGGIVSINLYDT